MPLPSKTFSNFQQLFNYIEDFWTTNGVQEITGEIGNNVVNGLLTFIEQSPLNWQKVQIVSTGGAVVAQRPEVLIMSAVPTSFSWTDNIYNEYVFINTTNADIPLLNGTLYYDINLQAITILPAKSVINIVKANNNNWVVASASSGTAATPLSLRLVVGEAGAPVAGQSTFQHNGLVGISPTLNRYSFKTDGQWQDSWGLNQTFDFDSDTGTIDISPNKWVSGSAIELPLLKTAV